MIELTVRGENKKIAIGYGLASGAAAFRAFLRITGVGRLASLPRVGIAAMTF